MATDTEVFRDLNPAVIAGAQQGTGLFQISLSKRPGPPPDTPSFARGFETGVDPLTQDVALEFRQGGEDVEGQFGAEGPSMRKRTLRAYF
jgi:hypothetical protein